MTLTLVVCLVLLSGCDRSDAKPADANNAVQDKNETQVKPEEKREDTDQSSANPASSGVTESSQSKPDGNTCSNNASASSGNNSSSHQTDSNSAQLNHSGNSSSNEKKGHYEERTVLVRETYDEQVLVKEGWTEHILVKDGWTEEINECTSWEQEVIGWEYVCNACGFTTTSASEIADHETWGCRSSWHNGAPIAYGEKYCVAYNTRTVNHPAEYNDIYHEPEYKTVHHEAEYKNRKNLG